MVCWQKKPHEKLPEWASYKDKLSKCAEYVPVENSLSLSSWLWIPLSISLSDPYYIVISTLILTAPMSAVSWLGNCLRNKQPWWPAEHGREAHGDIHQGTYPPSTGCSLLATGRDVWMCWVSVSPLGDQGIRTPEFGPWSSQTNECRTHLYLSLPSQVLGVISQNNVIRSWLWQLGLTEGQRYKVTLSARCHNSEPVLVWP